MQERPPGGGHGWGPCWRWFAGRRGLAHSDQSVGRLSASIGATSTQMNVGTGHEVPLAGVADSLAAADGSFVSKSHSVKCRTRSPPTYSRTSGEVRPLKKREPKGPFWRRPFHLARKSQAEAARSSAERKEVRSRRRRSARRRRQQKCSMSRSASTMLRPPTRVHLGRGCWTRMQRTSTQLWGHGGSFER